MRTLKTLLDMHIQNDTPATATIRGATVPHPTRRAKQSDARQFLKYLKENVDALPTVKHWTPGTVRGFRDYQLSKYAPATVARRLSTLHRFGERLSQELGIRNAAAGVTVPPFSPPEVKPLTHNEVHRLRHAIADQSSGYRQARNVLYFDLLYHLGLRPSEPLEIIFSDVDLEGRYINHIRCKGAKYQRKLITAGLAKKLRAFLPLRLSFLRKVYATRGYRYDELSDLVKDSHPLLVSSTRVAPGFPQTFHTSYKAMFRVLRTAGIASGIEVSPHTLRHTFASEIYKVSGNDIVLTANALGHSSTRTTMRYTRRTQNQIDQAMCAREEANDTTE